ncbi:MAG: hypothetical protein VKM01_03055 [Cyanobacteriota bacterium]|nr:hypothetical protein [Cyanobacteriota bacterium]
MNPPVPTSGPPDLGKAGGASAFLRLPLQQRLEAMRLLGAQMASGATRGTPSLDAIALQLPAPLRPEAEAGPARADPLAMELAMELAVLQRHGLLDDLLRRHLVGQLIDAVALEPGQASGDPTHDEDRRLRAWIEATYAPLLEAWLLGHQQAMETWIYGCLRVGEESLAAELHLQLIDDGADISVLVDRHGQGVERWTRGVVGPVRAAQVEEPIRRVLETLEVGAIQPPLQVGDDWLILQLLHRFPAEADGAWRDALLWDLFQRDLDGMVERARRRLQPGVPSLEAALEGLAWQVNAQAPQLGMQRLSLP